MTMKEFIKSRRKKAVLLFFAGFFAGGILYFLCQNPAADALNQAQENLLLWTAEKQKFLETLLFVLWERGKVFSILWLAGNTKIYKTYICAFITYVSLQSGFLLTFFIMMRGMKGILYWFVSGMPHLLLLVPLYIYSFFRICEKRRDKSVAAVVFIVIIFVVSCLLEAKVNVPLMQWVYE